MPENYYPESDETMGQETMESEEGQMADEQTGELEGNEAGEGATSLVPLSLFKGQAPEVGTHFKGTVVRIYDDEAEIRLESMPMGMNKSGMSASMPAEDELDNLAKE